MQLEPLVLGGQEYRAGAGAGAGEADDHEGDVGQRLHSSASRVQLHGPCFRCLRDTAHRADDPTRPSTRRTNPGGDEELESPYIADDSLDLSAWARDALALELPEKILHSPDCAGLCPVCGKDLNDEPHTHDELAADPRWAALDQLRGQL